MCLMQYIAYGHYSIYEAVIETHVFRTLKIFKMERFAKRRGSVCGTRTLL